MKEEALMITKVHLNFVTCWCQIRRWRLAMDPIIHEDYQKDFQYNNDIALLKLAEEVDNPFLNMFFF